MHSIGVVIVNYNAHRQIRRCLTSLKQTCRQDLHFIVVDNSPVPELDLVAQDHPDIVGIAPGENLGFGGGCNRGIAHALSRGCDFVLLLNPDTRAEEDFVGILVDELRKDERRAIAGPRIVRDNDRRDLWYGGARMNWWLGGPVQIFDGRYDGHGTVRVPYVSGCAMLIRSSAIREVGPLPEEYFLYYEDVDYCQRFLGKGLEVIYVPAAVLIHDASSTVGFQSEDYVYYFSRNRIWFMRRWARWYHFLAFMTFNTLIKIPGAIVVFGVLRRKPELTTAYLKGYWHGMTAPRADYGKPERAA